ncbi:MAG: macro domain-containing protein [Gemmataceae bacterium]|nr:macro domain-containing protein [Gemmataceae bacterium]
MKTLKPFGSLAPDALRLTLGDINAEISQAFAAEFGEVPGVEVVCGNLLDSSCDGIVSPANSFGDMGGGIDKAIDDFHRGEAQRRVMAAIAERFFGELPVGAALVVELQASRFPFVVAAPTMRIPGGVQGSINAYLSMRAALVAVLKHNCQGGRQIRSLAVPGLGTGVGGLGYEEAAEQMRAAYDNVVGGEWRQIVHAAQAPFALGNRRRTRRST